MGCTKDIREFLQRKLKILPPIKDPRHERAVYAMHRCLHYHGLFSRPNPSEFPLAGNQRGGPDLMVFGSKFYALDFTFCKREAQEHYTESTTRAYAAKVAAYVGFEAKYHLHFAPIVFTAYGSIERRSAATLRSFANACTMPKIAYRDMIAHSIVESIRGTLQGLITLHGRAGGFSS